MYFTAFLNKDDDDDDGQYSGADLGGVCRECAPRPPPPPSLPLRRPAFFFVFVIKICLRPVTSQLCHSLVVHPLLKKVLDPPLVLSSVLYEVQHSLIFPRLVLLGMISFEQIFKTVVQKQFQYDVNNIGVRF